MKVNLDNPSQELLDFLKGDAIFVEKGNNKIVLHKMSNFTIECSSDSIDDTFNKVKELIHQIKTKEDR